MLPYIKGCGIEDYRLCSETDVSLDLRFVTFFAGGCERYRKKHSNDSEEDDFILY